MSTLQIHYKCKCTALILFLFPCLLTYSSAQDTITPVTVTNAEKLIDMQFSQPQIDSMIGGLKDFQQSYKAFHTYQLPNNIPMPMWFDPVLPGMHFNMTQEAIRWDIPDNVSLPNNMNDLAFYSIKQLASLIKNKKITSVALTRFFIDRLKKYGNTLHCVISIPEDIAMREAKQADADLAKGIYRGPLQGIPYGVKDLFAVKGTYTTWGTPPYKDQKIDETAFVVQQLQKAGAVLVAKLSMGELAMDDVWFGGLTRNPWDTAEGSSGSSAGSAAATVAGLVPFALGTETWGSIVSPSTVCGALGLRPTFGSVSRYGAMTLAWTSDKVGPLCRTAEDAAIVFATIHGTDGKDAAARNMPFNYKEKIDISKLKIAYATNYIDTLPANSNEKKVLATLKKLGAHLTPIIFPDTLHANDILSVIVGAESAAAFDPLTRSHRDSLMVQQREYSWPNQFRTARFIPAVEYINAERLRYTIMEQVDPLIEKYDVIVVPSFIGEQEALTNLTGQPVVSVPDGFNKDGNPTSITFIGNLYDEATILEVAKAYQQATGFYLEHPPLFKP
jgi:Asp-tRNA(Asn)/Glu-tRNA(Gln) amidotransferase A subunit family amidase